jgi:ActR/RegA family two-component response regulator
MTGYSEDYTREEALRLGAQDYITKPFDVDEVRLILLKSCMKVEAGREGGP